MENFQKQAALGAKAVAGGAVAGWLGFAYFTRPVPTGGIDSTLHLVVMAATFMVFGLLSAAHFWFGQQLTIGRDSIRG